MPQQGHGMMRPVSETVEALRSWTIVTSQSGSYRLNVGRPILVL
jgi:hypothetical protein